MATLSEVATISVDKPYFREYTVISNSGKGQTKVLYKGRIKSTAIAIMTLHNMQLLLEG